MTLCGAYVRTTKVCTACVRCSLSRRCGAQYNGKGKRVDAEGNLVDDPKAKRGPEKDVTFDEARRACSASHHSAKIVPPPSSATIGPSSCPPSDQETTHRLSFGLCTARDAPLTPRGARQEEGQMDNPLRAGAPGTTSELSINDTEMET